MIIASNKGIAATTIKVMSRHLQPEMLPGFVAAKARKSVTFA